MAAGDISLSVVAGKALEGDDADFPVLVSVNTPNGTERTPSDIVIVIDISWSMSMEAKVVAAGGAVESNGLSMLDIAKHAAKTILRTLGPKDRVSFVTFCRQSEMVLPLTEMTQSGKVSAEQALENVGFGNGTALWQGLELAFETLQSTRADAASQDRLAHVMLLTDGTTEDKVHVMPNLHAMKQKYGQLPATINAFGFGYEIDSELLVHIADFSEGSYAFIPDAGFVGTIFVNCMGNLLVTMARDAVLSLEVGPGCSDVKPQGGWVPLPSSDAKVTRIHLGTLQYGQTKDLVVRMNAKASGQPFLKATLDCTRPGLKASTAAAEGRAAGDSKAFESVWIHRCRSIFVDSLVSANMLANGESASEDSVKAAMAELKKGSGEVASSPVAKTEQVAALLEDMYGQSTEALSRLDYYKKWGRHYLPSVMLAHKLEQCNNFKDPGVQLYGGELFDATRDAADVVFDSMPAPQVTPAMYRYLGDGKVIRNPTFNDPAGGGAPAVNMAAYNDRYAGCIDGDSCARLATGEARRVADLLKGDRVLTGGSDSGEAEVVCVVRSRCSEGRARLVELPDGTRLTPYHPVLQDGEWKFPVELSNVEEYGCEAVYSIILHGSPCLQVGSTPCIALGHGLEDGAAKHPYFGSERVLEDLRRLPGFGAGFVELGEGGGFQRDPATGLVCGLRLQ